MSESAHAARPGARTGLASDLAECTERILGLRAGAFPGLSDGRAVAGLGERLAAWNLGLVRVADPDSFAWAGYWIGVVQRPDGTRRAAVFFGVPSRPLEDRDAALAVDAPLVDGYVVAPLDIGRAYGADAYGQPRQGGVVVGLFTAPMREAPCEEHERRAVRAGRGLDGDRYAEGNGTFSHPQRRGQDLTLIEAESLEELSARGVTLPMADARRNIVTRGIDLNGLVGHHFTIGEVPCYGARLAEPCAHLERLTTPGVLRGLVHRGGIRVDVLGDGDLCVGDEISHGGTSATRLAPDSARRAGVIADDGPR
jgi:MOSC domain-containing protein YiiM